MEKQEWQLGLSEWQLGPDLSVYISNLPTPHELWLVRIWRRQSRALAVEIFEVQPNFLTM